jgi:hypothetical protein
MEELLALEKQGWDALCNGTGSDFYGKLMTHDALMVMANGQVMTRQEVVEALRNAPPWEAFEFQDPRTVLVGSEGGAIVYRCTAHRPGAAPFEGAMSSVYVRMQGEWRLALYQQTPTR